MEWDKIYKNLINTAIYENRSKGPGIYYENHHIIPKHAGGKNDPTNLVLLTFREHYLAHYLLWRIYKRKQDKLMYIMRSNQKEEAQRLRNELAVHANRNTGKGFLIFSEKNPMKNPDSVNKAVLTKRKKYGNAGICSKSQYDNVVTALTKINSDPKIKEKRLASFNLGISKLSEPERKKRFGRYSEKNGNYGWIKGKYEALDPNGTLTEYESQDQIIKLLGVSQSTLIRYRNKGKINCKSTNPNLKKWNDWQFLYYKKPHPRTKKLFKNKNGNK